MKSVCTSSLFAILAVLLLALSSAARADVVPGETINRTNASKVSNLLSPGNYLLVEHGMELNIVPTAKVEWPPPYKSATEKYSAQVKLGSDGRLLNYVAGLPFPLIDVNDPEVALKIMWNYSFRPLYSDDLDLREPQVASYTPQSHGSPLSSYTVGRMAFYSEVGRLMVPPVPSDPDAAMTGIRYRFGLFPFLEPSTMRGYGMVRYDYLSPSIEDNVWVYVPTTRRVVRQPTEVLSDASGPLLGYQGGAVGGRSGGFGISGTAPYVSTIDPDSYFGFSGKILNFNYRFLGERTMLAVVNAKNSPERPCPFDGGKSVCPENWELRHLYIIEATEKPGRDFSIPRRVFYIDSEGWFITASDQYDRSGNLWKTIATFNTYRDRPVPDARIAIYPYKRLFQLAMVDYDVQSGASSVMYMPGRDSAERECWYIDMGLVDKSFFTPLTLRNAGH